MGGEKRLTGTGIAAICEALREIKEWQVATFGRSTPESCLRHLRKEIWEIRSDLRRDDLPSLAFEFADIVFLAVQGHTRCGHRWDTDPAEIDRVAETGPAPSLEETYRLMRRRARTARQYITEGSLRWAALEFQALATLGLGGIALCGRIPEEILWRKLAENRRRVWAKPDEFGVVEHVRWTRESADAAGHGSGDE